MDLPSAPERDASAMRECVGGICPVGSEEFSRGTDGSEEPVQKVTIPFGATWKYWDHPVPPPEGWQAEGFDDSGWLSGPAPLGYCFREEGTHIHTESTIDPRPAYCRLNFELQEQPRDTGRIRLAIHRHGRIIAWLNGREVVRDNAPTLTVNDADYWTPSLTQEFPLQYSLNIQYLPLRRGSNLLAVEMRPCYRSICFDLALSLEDRSLPRQPVFHNRPASLLGEGVTLPDLVWTELDTNRTRSIREFLGQKVILDIMGAQCGPCWTAMPKLEYWAAHLREQNVAVAVVCSDGTRKDMRTRLTAECKNFPNVTLGVEPFGGDLFATVAYRELGVEAFPSMFLIDEKGIVRARAVGAAGAEYDLFVQQLEANGIRLPSDH